MVTYYGSNGKLNSDRILKSIWEEKKTISRTDLVTIYETPHKIIQFYFQTHTPKKCQVTDHKIIMKLLINNHQKMEKFESLEE